MAIHKIKGLTTILPPTVFIAFKAKMEANGWKEECPIVRGWRMSKRNFVCFMDFVSTEVLFYTKTKGE